MTKYEMSFASVMNYHIACDGKNSSKNNAINGNENDFQHFVIQRMNIFAGKTLKLLFFRQ